MMVPNYLSSFEQVWLVDFQCQQSLGERAKPLALTCMELSSSEVKYYELEQINSLDIPPFGIGLNDLVIGFDVSQISKCHLSLGWDLPRNVLDLLIEFRNVVNGLFPQSDIGLNSALDWYRVRRDGLLEKEAMCQIYLNDSEQYSSNNQALKEYAEVRLKTIESLNDKMTKDIDISLALLRGKYINTVAKTEDNGVPVDNELLKETLKQWPKIKSEIISIFDADYGVYQDGSFITSLFSSYLCKNNIPWPRLKSGALMLDDETFKLMALRYPTLKNLQTLRSTLSKLRSTKIAIGSDNRNRCDLRAFCSRTGRNQPRNSQALFGSAVWMRSFIKPDEGKAIAYIDYAQQEFGIAGALSGDLRMKEAYVSGDPYLEFAKQAGAVPLDATKQTHSTQRALFKECVLAVQYGMTYKGLANRIGQSETNAKVLIEKHMETYEEFWCWSQRTLDHAMLNNSLHTTFGWTIHIDRKPNPRFLRNFPMQANGAEMLRLACILGCEEEIKICAPIHDAVLIEAPIEQIENAVSRMQHCMERASELVLDGFKLRTDAEIFRSPERYMDPRGERMWNTVMGLLGESGAGKKPNSRASAIQLPR